MSSDSPYLSIVAVSRNDDHGGRLLERMQHFVDCLSEQVNLLRFPVELILVEWNPPDGRQALARALSWPGISEFFTVRIITVPTEIHNRLQHADTLPLFQMIGKNVGIRRARGRYILATNIDIIFSQELMQWLAKRRLKRGFFYRTNRVDVDANIPRGVSLGEKLAYCRSHVIRVNSRYFLSNTGNLRALLTDIVTHPALLGYYLKNLVYKIRIPRLHYNACGDFTLMAREEWDALRGYPELEMYSLHIDSLLLMAASYSGLQEQVCHSPQEIYHIEHSIGSGVTPGMGQKVLFQRLEREGIPYLSWRDCVRLYQKLKGQVTGGKKIIRCNEGPWGLPDTPLPEQSMGGRA